MISPYRWVCGYVCVCVCTYVYIHIHVYVCVYICVYIHMHMLMAQIYIPRPELSELYLHSQLLPQINMPKSQLCEIAPPRTSKVV